MRTVTIQDLRTLLDRDEAVVIDVREPEEFGSGHVPGARLVPLATVPQVVPDLPADRPLYVICQSGQRSAYAAQYLVQRGFDACNVEGGTGDWMAAGFAVER